MGRDRVNVEPREAIWVTRRNRLSASQNRLDSSKEGLARNRPTRNRPNANKLLLSHAVVEQAQGGENPTRRTQPPLVSFLVSGCFLGETADADALVPGENHEYPP